MAESGCSPEGDIRKLRKKLRQIENLEHLPRTLTEEEAFKVTQKCELRRRLAELLRGLAERDPEPPTPATAPPPVTTAATGTATEPAPRHDGGDGMKRTATEDSGDAASGARCSARVAPEPASAPAKQPKREARSDDNPEKTPEKAPRAAQTAAAGKRLKETKPAEEPEAAALRQLRERWRNARFAVTALVGHSDLVTAITFHGSYIISGSRDTTVKLWHAATGTEEANLGGHTGSVTCLAVAPAATAAAIGKALDCAEDEDFLASGSTDCTVRIWSLRTGQEVRNVYTFSPVSAMAFLPEPGLLLSASDGGKLDMWDLTTGDSVQSVRAHDDAVTCLQLHGSLACTGGRDGQLRVWELRAGPRLHLLFCTESERRRASPLRCVLLAPRQRSRLVYHADDGASVRVLDWRTGSLLRKLPNHNSECGFTDSLVTASCGGGGGDGDDGARLMLSSGYDLDRGHGYINVRLLAEGREPYVATLGGEAIPRILCVATTSTTSGLHRWGTGGRSLLLWEQLPPAGGAGSRHHEHVVEASFRREFERDGDGCSSDDEGSASDSSLGSSSRASSSEDETEPANGRRSWCGVM